MGVDTKTLEKHYGHELDCGAEVATEKVAGVLYAKAIDPKGGMPNVVAAIFWLKARGRWKEVSGVEHTGPDGQALPEKPSVMIVLPDNRRQPELVEKMYGKLAPAPQLIEADRPKIG